MPTRTAPDASVASANEITTTLHFIDASGDLFTEAITTTTAPTLLQVEAWAAGYQGATQASLYQITQSQKWVGDADPQNADVGQRNSVKDGINLLYRNNTTLKSQTPRVIAPIANVMQGNQDIPLLSATEMTTLLTALGAVLSGYDLQSAQYTERRERSNNPRVKV